MFWAFVIPAALAAPPSSTLTGPEGTLSWTVTGTDPVEIRGTSPTWTVTHTAAGDLTPRSSTRESDGQRWTSTFDAEGATVTNPDGSTTRVDHAGIWDGDTLDVRLGQHIAEGGGSTKFTVLDAAGGKAWTMNATVDRSATCAVACTHVRVQLAGAWRFVGPTWDYWYAADGRLLTFHGPIGRYTTEGGAK